MLCCNAFRDISITKSMNKQILIWSIVVYVNLYLHGVHSFLRAATFLTCFILHVLPTSRFDC
ncbi:hypothetical protein LINPERPRIM_LOCUS13444, partial [Linum perenne]